MQDQLEVITANDAFYEALGRYDIDDMSEIWAKDPWVTCVHPGWKIIYGWEEIEESWKSIFSSEGRLEVSVSHAQVHLAGDYAWVICNENISTTLNKNFFRSNMQATNIFMKQRGRWLMVHHHASPIPEPEPQEFGNTVQ